MDNNNARYPVRVVSLSSYLKIPVLTMGDPLKVIVAGGIKRYLSRGAKTPFDGGDLAQYDQGDNLANWSREPLGDRAYEYPMGRWQADQGWVLPES